MSDANILITTKTLGRKGRLLDDWSMPIPPDVDDGSGITLRELISRIVRQQVASFVARQRDQRFLKVLSKKEIDAAAQRGKIDSGGRDLRQSVDPDVAVGAAIAGFEDGLYLVSIDGHEQRELDAPVCLQPDSRVTFIRLVFLAGA